MTYNGLPRRRPTTSCPTPTTASPRASPGSPTSTRGAPSGSPSYYVVRAVDAANGTEDVESRASPGDRDRTDRRRHLRDRRRDRRSAARHARAAAGRRRAASRRSMPAGICSRRASTPARAASSRPPPSACITLETDRSTSPPDRVRSSRFWTVWDIEATYDGGIVQISTNGGSTWTRLSPAGGYPNTITHSGNACAGDANGTPAFSSGTASSPGSRRASTSPPTPDRRSASPGATAATASSDGEGWYVDDIAAHPRPDPRRLHQQPDLRRRLRERRLRRLVGCGSLSALESRPCNGQLSNLTAELPLLVLSLLAP